MSDETNGRHIRPGSVIDGKTVASVNTVDRILEIVFESEGEDEHGEPLPGLKIFRHAGKAYDDVTQPKEEEES